MAAPTFELHPARPGAVDSLSGNFAQKQSVAGVVAYGDSLHRRSAKKQTTVSLRNEIVDRRCSMSECEDVVGNGANLRSVGNSSPIDLGLADEVAYLPWGRQSCSKNHSSSGYFALPIM